MTDRLADLVVGLQRMADNAAQRGDDLRYMQHQEIYDHIGWLDQQLNMVEKVRAVLLEERKKFLPVERERPAQLPQQTPQAPQTPQMPRVVAQGPKAAQR
jgi:hypothetical protein